LKKIFRGVKMSKDKPVWKQIRLPLPKKAGHPQGTKKGKRGYNRKGRRVEK